MHRTQDERDGRHDDQHHDDDHVERRRGQEAKVEPLEYKVDGYGRALLACDVRSSLVRMRVGGGRYRHALRLGLDACQRKGTGGCAGHRVRQHLIRRVYL